MKLNLKSFSQLIEDMGAALQSSASSLINVSIGSVVRAIFEANASVVLWMQWLIIQVLQSTRASTSSGSDLDSWMLDFGSTRLPAISATGIITLSRFAANLPAVVPVGTFVKTADGLASFLITVDHTSSIWQPDSLAYVLPSGVASANVPVSCTTGGAAGNVLAGTITVIAASLPGIDQVNNLSPLINGADAEGDQAFRDRFQSYLVSRSRATLTAVQNAVAGIRQNLTVAIQENAGSDGTSAVGSFLVVVDDGTGYPSSDILSAVAAAVEPVRPIGTRFAVVPPQVLIVNVSMTVDLALAVSASPVVSGIQKYVAAYLNTLPIGDSASVTRLAQNAYLAAPGIRNITGIQLNGLPFDIAPPLLAVIKCGQIAVTAQ